MINMGMKCICDILRGNNAEAKKYMEKAASIKNEDKALADWMRTMAIAHINFNNDGVSLAKKHLEEMKNKKDRPDFYAGKAEAYEELCDDLAFEMSEIKSMIDSYK